MPDPIEDASVDVAALTPAAIELGLNPESMTEDDWAFVNVFTSGDLASTPPLVPGDELPPDAPIPAEGTPTTAEAEAGRDGLDIVDDEDGSEASEGTTLSNEGGAPSPPAEPELVQAPVGAPAYEIPSPLLPLLAPAQPTPEEQPQYVQLANGAIVTLEQAIALQQQQQPVVTPPSPNPWENPEEYLDPRAQADIAAVNERLATHEQNMALLADQQRQQYTASLQLAIDEAQTGWAAARGLNVDQLDTIVKSAEDLGLPSLYAQHFPGDPRRVVGASLEAAYRMSDEYVTREVESRLAKERAELTDIERKRAAGGALGGSSASVSRTPPRPTSRAEADRAIVAEIEAAQGAGG